MDFLNFSEEGRDLEQKITFGPFSSWVCTIYKGRKEGASSQGEREREREREKKVEVIP